MHCDLLGSQTHALRPTRVTLGHHINSSNTHTVEESTIHALIKSVSVNHLLQCTVTHTIWIALLPMTRVSVNAQTDVFTSAK